MLHFLQPLLGKNLAEELEDPQKKFHLMYNHNFDQYEQEHVLLPLNYVIGRTKTIDGGIICPNVPAAATVPVAILGS